MPGKFHNNGQSSNLQLIQDANRRYLLLKLILLYAESAFLQFASTTNQRINEYTTVSEEATVHLNSMEEQPYNISNRIDQGNPPSAKRYIIVDN